MACIYKITNLINNKVYIGQTIEALEKRFCKHSSNSRSNRDCYKQIYFYKAIKRYGLNNFIPEIIVEGNYNKLLLNDLEKHFIRLYNSNNPSKGYNSTIGGDSSTYIRTPEIKIRISESLKGHSYNKGIKKSQSHKIKVRNSMLKLYENGYRMGSCKYCYIYDLNNNLIKKYNTVTEAGKDLKIARQKLFKMSNGESHRDYKNIKVVISK